MNSAPDKEVSRVGRILVADDDRDTCNFLKTFLERHGHTVEVAEDGNMALAEVSRNAPDVVLLDMRMPGLSGLDVCHKLKADAATAAIRVLMITGHDDRNSRLAGIRAGADDFLAKPVDNDEVILRVGNAVHTKHLFDQVQESYRRLQEVQKMRDDLTQMVMHDMRTPLTSIVMSLEFLASTGGKQPKDVLTEAFNAARAATRELLEMANSMLDVSRLEQGRMPLTIRTCSLIELVRDAIHLLKPMLGRARIVLDEPRELGPILCDGDVIRRVVVNLLGNAVKATEFREAVDVTIRQEGDKVRVSVRDQGQPIQAKYHAKLFERFGESEMGDRQSHSVGLGLPFCKLAVEAHGGSIGITSEMNAGNTFWFVLPITGPAA